MKALYVETMAQNATRLCLSHLNGNHVVDLVRLPTNPVTKWHIFEDQLVLLIISLSISLVLSLCFHLER